MNKQFITQSEWLLFIFIKSHIFGLVPRRTANMQLQWRGNKCF